MDAIEWDGIYGESDTFLPVEDVEAAERETAATTQPVDDESLPDLDQQRARRRPR